MSSKRSQELISEPGAADEVSSASKRQRRNAEGAATSGAVDAEDAGALRAVDAEGAAASGAVDAEGAAASGAVDAEDAGALRAVDAAPGAGWPDRVYRLFFDDTRRVLRIGHLEGVLDEDSPEWVEAAIAGTNVMRDDGAVWDPVGALLLLVPRSAYELSVEKPSDEKTWVFFFKVSGGSYDAIVTNEAGAREFKACANVDQDFYYRTCIQFWFQDFGNLSQEWWDRCCEGRLVHHNVGSVILQEGCKEENVRLVFPNPMGKGEMAQLATGFTWEW